MYERRGAVAWWNRTTPRFVSFVAFEGVRFFTGGLHRENSNGDPNSGRSRSGRKDFNKEGFIWIRKRS